MEQTAFQANTRFYDSRLSDFITLNFAVGAMCDRILFYISFSRILLQQTIKILEKGIGINSDWEQGVCPSELGSETLNGSGALVESTGAWEQTDIWRVSFWRS